MFKTRQIETKLVNGEVGGSARGTHLLLLLNCSKLYVEVVQFKIRQIEKGSISCVR